jgi:hypothetical protein
MQHVVTGYYAGSREGLENYTIWNPFAATAANQYCAKALTIDVTAELPVTTQAMTNNTGLPRVAVGGVLISLPTMEMAISDMVFVPRFDDLVAGVGGLNCINDGKDYGTIVIQGMTVAVLNGWLEISPH